MIDNHLMECEKKTRHMTEHASLSILSNNIIFFMYIQLSLSLLYKNPNQIRNETHQLQNKAKGQENSDISKECARCQNESWIYFFIYYNTILEIQFIRFITIDLLHEMSGLKQYTNKKLLNNI